jgi:GNAT superfamily N-acetyltransferase
MAISASGVQIDTAQPGDLGDLCDLFIAMQVHYGGRAATSGQELREALRSAFFSDAPMADCLIARFDERPAGFATYALTFPSKTIAPELYLKDLYTLEGTRQRGVGRALMTHLARIAAERGCQRMRWMTGTDDSYGAARGLYERVGATQRQDAALYELTGEALAALAAEAGDG